MNDTRIVISYKGIPDGVHDYEFTIGDAFFVDLGYAEFEHGKLNVRVGLEKRNSILAMDLSIDGEVEVCCDRCLDFFLMPVQYYGRVYASETGGTSPATDDEDYDTVAVDVGRMEVDLTHYIYESICLSMPLQRIHPDDADGHCACNAEMLKILNSHLLK